MRAFLRAGQGLIFRAEDVGDAAALRRAFKAGHLHLVCKAVLTRPKGRGLDLVLCPSIVKWKRP